MNPTRYFTSATKLLQKTYQNMDPAKYEALRNQTLLFFIEKLLDEQNKKRTLHDLSCQFGSRGFTKEMRQIAGNSQSGLKKFLQEYPSIFEISDDLVGYRNTSNKENNSKENYVKEAVDYFRERMIQYGIGVWVPVRSLLGHRSQAPTNLRHVSGSNLEEFRSFLMQHENIFKIENDSVFLKEFERVAPKIDQRKILNLIEFFGNVLESRGPMLVEQLFHVSGGNAIAMEFFKGPNDVKSFLNMRKECFEVHQNLVTLSDSYKVGLEYFKSKPNVRSDSENHVNILKKELTPLNLDLKNEHIQEKKPTLKNKLSQILLKTLTDNEPKKQFLSSNINFKESLNNEQDLNNFLSSKSQIVSSTKKAKEILQNLKKERKICLDLEGVNLGDGEITLVLICCRGVVFIFDVLTMGGIFSELREILESEHVLKILHDCRNDSFNLFKQHGILLRNVFDTQIAHFVLNKEKQLKNLSLNDLCEAHGVGVRNPLKDGVKAIYKSDHRFWSRRPLSKQMISYSACDVLCLEYLYDKLGPLVENNLFLKELTEEQLLININPEEIKKRRKQRKNEGDLIELKDKIEKSIAQDTMIVLSNREMRLLKHLSLSDVAKDKLKESLKIAKKLEKLENKVEDGGEEFESLEEVEPPDRLTRIEGLIGELTQLDRGLGVPPLQHDDLAELSWKTVATQTQSTGDIVVLSIYDGD